MNTLGSLDNTIFAWATAYDPGGRSVLRVSGPTTFSVLQRVFRSDGSLPERGTAAGFLCLSEELKVQAWVWIFPGPRSYTGQDMIEFHLVGSVPLMRWVDQIFLEMGLSPARAGEFSARAFLLGKMDLTQAQAVARLVEADNDAQIQAALNQFEGTFHERVERVYQVLSDLAVKLEANIDFSEENIELIRADQASQMIDGIIQIIDGILNTAIDIQAIRSLPRVFMAGVVNAGKSTLLNRLSGLDRAMCSDLAGTTRDVLTAPWEYEGREALLCDTPGLAETAPDAVATPAVEHAARWLNLADLILLVLDAERDLSPQLQLLGSLRVHKEKAVAVLNKRDRVGGTELEDFSARCRRIFYPLMLDVYPVSALTGEGIVELSAGVFERLGGLSVTTGAGQIALDLRERESLARTREALDRARTCLGGPSPAPASPGMETAAFDVQEALRNLGELLGKDVTEDVLDRIFSRFCIGK